MSITQGSIIAQSFLAASLLTASLATPAQDTARPASPPANVVTASGTPTHQPASPCAMLMMGRGNMHPMHRPGGMGAPAGMDGIGMTDSALASLGMLVLSADQRAGVNKIQDELCKKRLDLANQIAGNQAELRALYTGERRDAKAIDKQHEKLFALQRMAIEADVEAADRIEALLTTEQRNAIKKFHIGPNAGKSQGPSGR